MSRPFLSTFLTLPFLGVVINGWTALADTPASAVRTETVGPGQQYPGVNANSEAWFDVGGFCKVVDVGSLPGDARGIPVFIPGPSGQWENWRTNAPQAYGGRVASTTCCTPQGNIATLCASSFNPQQVSRQYGRLGEVDTVSAICLGPYGQYTESVPVTCTGDNGPDGHATWQAGGDSDVCAPNARTTYGSCQAAGGCGIGTQTVTVWNSCGQVQSQSTQSCNTGVSCCTPSGTSCGACSGSCGGGWGTQTCSNGCSTWSQSCQNNASCGPQLIGGGSCTLQWCSNCGTGVGCYTCGEIPSSCPDGWDYTWTAWGAGNYYPPGCNAGYEADVTATSYDCYQ